MTDQTSAQTSLTAGYRLIVAERQRQIEAEGYYPDRDDVAYDSTWQLKAAAKAYRLALEHPRQAIATWPWNWTAFKVKNARSNLVRSGALFLAARDWARRHGLTKEADDLHLDAVEVAVEIDNLP